MLTKRDFLVVYDYGSGGVWAVISARDQQEISNKFNGLYVVDQRPAWITDQEYADILHNMYFDIDDEPRSEWLKALIR